MMTNQELFKILSKEYPDQIDRVFLQPYCEIEPDFMGFINTYEMLSKIIPKNFKIVDIGASYCAQGYFFREHELYIGIDSTYLEYFQFPNSRHLVRSIHKLQAYFMGCNMKEIFAIMNYVPCSKYEAEIVRKLFPNLYCFYPYGKSLDG